MTKQMKSVFTRKCLVMSTSQGLRLHSRLSLSIMHSGLSLESRMDTPRPQVFEHGLQEVVWVMQLLCQTSLLLGDTKCDMKYLSCLKSWRQDSFYRQ